MDDYKSRKFILCLLAVLLATALVWFGKIDAKAYQSLVTLVIGAYVAGNVSQKVFAPATVTTTTPEKPA